MNKTTRLCATGLFAAIITLMTGFILHIPYGVNGGYVHFGDAFIFLAASLLPRPYALTAAVIGGGLADLLTAPMWMPATVIIKFLLVLSFKSETNKLISKRNIIAAVTAIPITVIGYYFAEAILFGSYITPIASIPGNIIQSTVSIAIYFFIAKTLEKTSVFSSLRK